MPQITWDSKSNPNVPAGSEEPDGRIDYCFVRVRDGELAVESADRAFDGSADQPIPSIDMDPLLFDADDHVERSVSAVLQPAIAAR